MVTAGEHAEGDVINDLAVAAGARRKTGGMWRVVGISGSAIRATAASNGDNDPSKDDYVQITISHYQPVVRCRAPSDVVQQAE